MKMAKPEMAVVRFKENDIIVASGDALSLSKFGDGQVKNGVVTYQNQAFTIADSSAINSVLTALNGAGHSGSTLLYNNNDDVTFDYLFKVEANTDGRFPTGVKSKNWNGDYLFIDGKFRKQ